MCSSRRSASPWSRRHVTGPGASLLLRQLNRRVSACEHLDFRAKYILPRSDRHRVQRSAGWPLAAVEYQGNGHYRGTAAARDAVKKEALRKAGVRYIAVTPDSGTEDMAREIARIAQADRPRSLAAAPPARP